MKRHNPRSSLLTAALAFLAMGVISLYLSSPLAYATPATRYVSATGDCGGATPCYASIQAAVDAAASGDSIKVAQGVYTSTAFQVVYIAKALSILGGYTTTNWTDSFSMTNPTIIDAENASRRRVVYVDSSSVGGTITLKSLIIQRGNSSPENGGGIYIQGGKFSLQDSQVLTNTAESGGGLYINGGSISIESDVIRGNHSSVGGGVRVKQGTVSINNTVLESNGDFYGHGGGIANEGGSIDVNGSSLLHNSGGVSQWGPAEGEATAIITVTQSLLHGNQCYYGAGIRIEGGRATIRESQILSNTSFYEAGGVLAYDNIEIVHSTIAGNTTGQWGSGSGGGIWVSGSNVALRENTIISNTARGAGGGGVFMQGGSLERNLIMGNTAQNGGGVYIGGGASLEGNRIISNTASSAGGGIQLGSGNLTAVNDILARNTSVYEGVYVSGGSLTARHWTIVGNGNYGVVSQGGTASITNSIAVSHTLGAFYGSGISADHTLFFANGATCSAGATCTNNVTGDPNFVDPASDDYHIEAGSPAIDAGINAGVTTDIDGEPRPYLGYDLGSDEYWPPGATLMTLASSANPSLVGQTVAFVATVIPPTGTPTGSVTFKDGGSVFCAAVPLAGGQATCAHSYSTPGVHAITAEYSGDGTFSPNIGTLAGGQTVNKANTTTTLTGHSPHPSRMGDAVTVHYSVAVNAPGSGTPTGNVTVSDGVNACTGSVAAGSCNVTLRTVGTRTLTATYAGDANLNGSTSTGVSHVVNPFDSYLPLIVR